MLTQTGYFIAGHDQMSKAAFCLGLEGYYEKIVPGFAVGCFTDR